MCTRPKILVVDDSQENCDYAADVLGERYEVIQASSGTEALGLSRTRPDLVLLDLDLPRRDGWAVLKEMRADPTLRGVPVLACTGHQGVSTVGLFDDCLFKPYWPKELLETVARFVGPGSDPPPPALDPLDALLGDLDLQPPGA